VDQVVAPPRRPLRIVLTLPNETFEALGRLARREERAPKVQAVRLLNEALRAAGELPNETRS